MRASEYNRIGALVVGATVATLAAGCGKSATSLELTQWQKKREELSLRVASDVAAKCTGAPATGTSDSAKIANAFVKLGFTSAWKLELSKFEARADSSAPKDDEYSYKEPDAACYLAASDRAALTACKAQGAYFKRTLRELDELAAKMEKCVPDR